MKVLVGGLVALVVGLVGIIVFWKQFLTLLAGGIPLLLLLFGGLATYLGLEELKDKLASGKETTPGVEEDYKKEIEKLKAELEELKKDKETSA
ncbi:MAG: hypothetical protein J7M03_02190 [Candidatus Desulfofervidaceae bacterium]|nr:hypothetical protein [Candidatus Desulfofervidaceae bacterium]MDL1969512.1 hypothetical protein [Candidatus Desulfofervidaceae bacterium]